MRFWLKKHRFLLRTFIILIFVFLIGFFAAGFIISYTTAGDYVDAQSSYEYEKMRGDADKLNEKLINISTSIMQTYQVDDERESLSTLLDKPDTKEREAAIREFMVKTIQGSPYITDIVLLDTQKGLVYSQSNILSQVFDSAYDWSADPFTKKVIESRNGNPQLLTALQWVYITDRKAGIILFLTDILSAVKNWFPGVVLPM